MHSDARRLIVQIFCRFVDGRNLLTGIFLNSVRLAALCRSFLNTKQILQSFSLTLQPTRPLSLVSLSLPLSSNRSWSRVYRGGGEWWGRHLWPSAAFCGLYYPCVIVLRDVDNHNRRRAGKPQSRGRNQGQLMVGGGGKMVRSLCVWVRGREWGMGRKG